VAPADDVVSHPFVLLLGLLASGRHGADELHEVVVARLAAVETRRVVDVGGHVLGDALLADADRVTVDEPVDRPRLVADDTVHTGRSLRRRKKPLPERSRTSLATRPTVSYSSSA